MPQWHCQNTGELWDEKKSCAKCNKAPTSEGYDACFGYISGAAHACCGHGTRLQGPYVLFPASVSIKDLVEFNARFPDFQLKHHKQGEGSDIVIATYVAN